MRTECVSERIWTQVLHVFVIYQRLNFAFDIFITIFFKNKQLEKYDAPAPSGMYT